MERVVIIGAGECGARVALALRERGFTGAVTLVGSEAHLPYERPPLSKEAMTAGLPPRLVADAARFAEAGIVVLTGTQVRSLDRATGEVRLESGESLAYDRLVLTTGARPRPFPGVDAHARRIRQLRTHADAMAIRAHLLPGNRLVVIGAGFIGLELAASARRMGVEVTVVEGQARVLSRGVPAEIAEMVAAAHLAEGVVLRCGMQITGLEDDERQARVTLGSGEVLPADLVVTGIGALPETDLAAAAGLVLDNGIAVDAMLTTSDPRILAAGDCCSFPLPLYDDRRLRLESWRNAQEQGAYVAARLTGELAPFVNVPWFWSDQYDLSLQIAGLADGAVNTVRRDLGEGAFLLFGLGEDGRLLSASGISRGNAVARDIRLAEMLIARRATPDPAALADPSLRLKSLLNA